MHRSEIRERTSAVGGGGSRCCFCSPLCWVVGRAHLERVGHAGGSPGVLEIRGAVRRQVVASPSDVCWGEHVCEVPLGNGKEGIGGIFDAPRGRVF